MKPFPPSKVTLTQASYDFILAETHQIHALCDRALVPRHIEGEILTMSQRVNILEGVCRGLVKKLGCDPVTIEH